MQARRSLDGRIVVDSQGPVWVSLGMGLLPRGLALAITEMSQVSESLSISFARAPRCLVEPVEPVLLFTSLAGA